MLELLGRHQREMMRGKFNAVDTPRKIAMRVLPRLGIAPLIFQYTRRAEFIVFHRSRSGFAASAIEMKRYV
jgi:hypothetical protein